MCSAIDSVGFTPGISTLLHPRCVFSLSVSRARGTSRGEGGGKRATPTRSNTPPGPPFLSRNGSPGEKVRRFYERVRAAPSHHRHHLYHHHTRRESHAHTRAPQARTFDDTRGNPARGFRRRILAAAAERYRELIASPVGVYAIYGKCSPLDRRLTCSSAIFRSLVLSIGEARITCQSRLRPLPAHVYADDLRFNASCASAFSPRSAPSLFRQAHYSHEDAPCERAYRLADGRKVSRDWPIDAFDEARR